MIFSHTSLLIVNNIDPGSFNIVLCYIHSFNPYQFLHNSNRNNRLKYAKAEKIPGKKCTWWLPVLPFCRIPSLDFRIMFCQNGKLSISFQIFYKLTTCKLSDKSIHIQQACTYTLAIPDSSKIAQTFKPISQILTFLIL